MTVDSRVGVEVTTQYAGNYNDVEVAVSRERSWMVGRVFGLGAAPVSASAVARRSEIIAPLPYALIALNPTACDAMVFNGGFDLQVNNGGGVMVNSNCAHYAVNINGATDTQTGPFHYFEDGGVDISGTPAPNVSPAPTTVPWTVPDPYADLPPINLATLGTSPDSCGTQAAPQTCSFVNGSRTLQPGVFWGGISLGGSADVTLAAGGIFTRAGGGFSALASSKVTASGVLLYNTGPACGALSFGGSADVQFTAYQSAPYANFSVWQDASCAVTMTVSGSVDMPTGTIYVPGAQFVMDGIVDIQGPLQIIADTMLFNGEGDLQIDFTPWAVGATGDFEVQLVE